MKRACILSAVSGLAVLSLSLRPVCAATPTQSKDAARSPYEPQAVQLLREMADAYTRLSSLHQETEFSSEILPVVPLPRQTAVPAASDTSGGRNPTNAASSGPFTGEHKLDRQLRLSFAAPNRLRLEVGDADEAGKLQVSRWMCDGKTFWSYNPDKNLFSREKAPGKIRDFAKLAHMTSGSLEILMLMGVNPFAHVEEQTEAVRCAGKETIRGIETDVVAMSADLGPQATETRLYIGAADRLLYRLVSETSQKARSPKRPATRGPLDELAPPDPADPNPADLRDLTVLPGVLLKSRVTYDNKIDVDPKFPSDEFAYKPPADAFYLTNPETRKRFMTLAQRIAELNRAATREKRSRSKVIHL